MTITSLSEKATSKSTSIVSEKLYSTLITAGLWQHWPAC